MKSFDYRFIRKLPALHRRIDVPVAQIRGKRDKFYPVRLAQQMVSDFAQAQLTVTSGAGLFAQEERPAEVAAALLPTLT